MDYKDELIRILVAQYNNLEKEHKHLREEYSKLVDEFVEMSHNYEDLYDKYQSTQIDRCSNGEEA